MKGQNSIPGRGSHTAKDFKVSGVLGVIKAGGPCSRERSSRRDEVVEWGPNETAIGRNPGSCGGALTLLMLGIDIFIWGALAPEDVKGKGCRWEKQKEGCSFYGHTAWVYTSLVAHLVKNLPTVWETWVRSLGWEDPLEKGKATSSSILAWRIPWTV